MSYFEKKPWWQLSNIFIFSFGIFKTALASKLETSHDFHDYLMRCCHPCETDSLFQGRLLGFLPYGVLRAAL